MPHRKTADYEESIKSLKDKRKDLLARKEKAGLAPLAKAVRESGKSVDDANRVIASVPPA